MVGLRVRAEDPWCAPNNGRVTRIYCSCFVIWALARRLLPSLVIVDMYLDGQRNIQAVYEHRRADSCRSVLTGFLGFRGWGMPGCDLCVNMR
jgi:hypothetical protein